MSEIAVQKPKSLLKKMADKWGMEANKLMDTLKETIIPNGKASDAQVASFLLVAQDHDLSPFTKEIYAFPSKGGGIIPIVGVDGWAKIINSHPQFDGLEFIDHFDNDRKLVAITAKMYRKDRKHATEVTEYYDECFRDTAPWKQYPARMLRHKALIQVSRIAFGFAGIYDPDEGDRIMDGEKVDVVEVKTNDRAKELKNRMKESVNGEVKKPKKEKKAEKKTKSEPEAVSV